MAEASLTTSIDELLQGRQHTLPQAQKEERLLGLFQDICAQQARACPPYGLFLNRLNGPPESWKSLADIPPLPVSMFKLFALSAVPPEQVVRELRSSSTTGQQPSRIFVDKATSFRQARALVSILREYLGTERRPFLVIDASESAGGSGGGGELTARGAAIRGVGNFASKTVYALRLLSGGDLEPNFQAIEEFFAAHAADPILLFGFTFIVWTRFIVEAERRGLRFNAKRAQLLHSGGWKKLEAQAVSKDEFTRRTAAVLGCPPESILDFYGMVEQVGTVFVDCPAGHKHAPAFADVIIRRPGTLAPTDPGEVGIIEVLSVLPSSYPGQAIMTEDQGIVLGVDDCPCGRLGRHFRFHKRIERIEVRGCGDIFAQSREAER